MGPVAQSRRHILQRKCKIEDFQLSNVVVFKSTSGMFTVLTKFHRCVKKLDFARKGKVAEQYLFIVCFSATKIMQIKIHT